MLKSHEGSQTLGQFLNQINGRKDDLDPRVIRTVRRVVGRFGQGGLLVEPYLTSAREAACNSDIPRLHEALTHGRGRGKIHASNQREGELGKQGGRRRRIGTRRPASRDIRPENALFLDNRNIGGRSKR